MEDPVKKNDTATARLWRFLMCNKKLWLLPIVIFVLLVTALLIFAGDSLLIPFIYGLF